MDCEPKVLDDTGREKEGGQERQKINDTAYQAKDVGWLELPKELWVEIIKALCWEERLVMATITKSMILKLGGQSGVSRLRNETKAEIDEWNKRVSRNKEGVLKKWNGFEAHYNFRLFLAVEKTLDAFGGATLNELAKVHYATTAKEYDVRTDDLQIRMFEAWLFLLSQKDEESE